MMTVKEAILTIVNSHQGVKGVELVLDVMGLINPLKFRDEEYALALLELIHEGEIVEIEYMLPHMDYRTKSMYFPKGTTIAAQINDWSPDTRASV